MEEVVYGGLPHADAFNPALVRWRGRTLIFYRTGMFLSNIYLGELDANLKPLGPFRKFELPGQLYCEDARFFIHQNQLYFSFVAGFSPFEYGTGIGRIADDLSIHDARLIRGPDPLLCEKNWIFFSHGGQIYFTYAMSDGVHEVFRVEGNRGIPAYLSHYLDSWKWGIARGGTQLVPHNGLLYGFFHGTDHACEGLERRYHLGAYAVDPKPPFPIVKMTDAPIYTPAESYCRHKPGDKAEHRLSVIFPTGLILENDRWLVMAGYNDQAIRLFKIGLDELESRLVSTVPGSSYCPPRRTARIHIFHHHKRDRFWQECLDLLGRHRMADEPAFVNGHIVEFQPGMETYTHLTPERLRQGLYWVVLHKGFVQVINSQALEELRRNGKAVLANEVFVVFTNKSLPDIEARFDRVHVDALWVQVEALKRKGSLLGVMENALNRWWLSGRNFFVPQVNP